MPSLHRHKNSPYWYASFRKPDGSWALKSTKETSRRKAEEICRSWDKAARDGEKGKLTESAARKVIQEIYAIANEEELSSATVKQYFSGWLSRKKVEAAEGTVRKYKEVTNQFVKYIGEKGDRDISKITRNDISNFRDSLIERLSAGTTNIAVKILRVAFGQAKRDKLISENPAEDVSIVKRREEKLERRPFSLAELKQIHKIANKEWKGMILFGLYTGQRIKDIGTLTWQNLDLEQNVMRLVTTKTGRRQILPLAKPLIEYLASMSASEDPKQPLFPSIHAEIKKTGRTGYISNQFYEILVSAGLAKERNHAGKGKGRSTKRETSELSFHCLRHTATSLLKNAGVSDAIAREFIGHESAAISANYTHIETEALRKAADSLPDILK